MVASSIERKALVTGILRRNENEEVVTSKWGALAIVLMGIVMGTLDTSIVNVAMPVIAKDLDATVNQMAWVQNSYIMTMAVALIPCGRYAELKGYRRTYIFGFVAFTLGSALCALSTSLEGLVGARIIQAVGGAAFVGCGGALLSLSFPASQLGRALGMVPFAVGIGITLGPVLGGIITNRIGWQWIFWINIPLGVLCVWMSIRYLKRPAKTMAHWFRLLNPRCIFILVLLVVCFVLGTNIPLEPGRSWGDTEVLFYLGSIPPLLILLIVIDQRTEMPLIPLQLFRDRVFLGSLACGVVSMVMVFAVLYLINYEMQIIQQFDTELTSYVLLTSPLCLSLLGPISGWVSDRYNGEALRISGIILSGIGVYLLSQLDVTHTAWDIAWRMIIYSAGLGIFQTPNNHITFSHVPKSIMGVSSGMIASVRVYGQLVGTVLATVFLGEYLRFHLGTEPPEVSELKPNPATVKSFNDTFLLIAWTSVFMMIFNLIGFETRKSREKLFKVRRSRDTTSLSATP